MKENEFFWLVILWEGEGCFRAHRGYYPNMCIQMTDVDVIQRAAKSFRKSDKVHKTIHWRSRKRPLYRFDINGKEAIGWMRRMYPHMGRRRKKQIENALKEYDLFNSKRGERSRTSKLRIEDVMEIRRLYGTQKLSQKKLAQMYRIGRSAISRIIHRKTWKYVN
ncbi:hypothetical protein KA005_11065 [bacterium]|nr:hypothetical protein [bacterium]